MKNLYLFTNQFPYKGGEPFLETEIHYLSQAFDEVIIYPLAGFENELLPIPNNVKVRNFNTNQPVYLRKLMLKHGWIIAKWFIIEFVKSPHRFKYISQFNWNFKRLAGLLNAAVGLAKELNKSGLTANKDTVIFYTYWFNEWASILSLANELGLNQKFVTRVHMYDFEEEFYNRKYLPFRRTEMRYPAKIFAISEYAANYLKKQFPGYADKIHTSKLGVEDIGFNPVNDEIYYIIVSCSSLTWYKRPLKLVELMSQMKLPIKWYHFGDGDMRDVFLEKTKHLPNHIEFFWQGHVSNTAVTKFYLNNQVDLLINVSSFEGIPVSLMEAISFGIPIAGCNICGQPEIINQQTGVLLEKEFNAQAAAKTLDEFLIKNSRNQIYRQQVKAFWQENFNAPKNYKQYISKIF
ncbi:MAG: glycosyltransferase [Bacteroidota bacterium]|nr:glycosyltransferase [Bacteroidota bacterium]